MEYKTPYLEKIGRFFYRVLCYGDSCFLVSSVVIFVSFVVEKQPRRRLICGVLASGREVLREAHVGAKRAKHRAKRSPECADPNVVRGTPKVSDLSEK